MITQHEVHTFIHNEPLLEAASCCVALNTFDASTFQKKSIFFGVGLCTDKKPAIAIPFDILSFFLIAERLKQFFGLSEVIILIADSHARTNSFMSEELIINLTDRTKQLCNKIIHTLHLVNFRIIVHSTISSNPSFQNILTSLPAMDNQYLRHELADILWLKEHHNLGIKLGWTIDSSPEPSGHDERFFDTELKKHIAIPVAFLHTKSGRTFDKHRQKVSPYISIDGETRLLLDPHENALEKFARALCGWNDPHFGGTTKHIATIARAFEKQCGSISSRSIPNKAQHIINTIFKRR